MAEPETATAIEDLRAMVAQLAAASSASADQVKLLMAANQEQSWTIAALLQRPENAGSRAEAPLEPWERDPETAGVPLDPNSPFMPVGAPLHRMAPDQRHGLFYLPEYTLDPGFQNISREKRPDGGLKHAAKCEEYRFILGLALFLGPVQKLLERLVAELEDDPPAEGSDAGAGRSVKQDLTAWSA